MHTITLYMKAGCHLCDEVREHLEDLSTQCSFDLREIDIRRDPALFEQYRYRIPVLVVDGAEQLEGRIEASDISALLTSLSARHTTL